MRIDKIGIVLSKWKVPARIIAILTGFLSLAWFLIRVVPKPHRATYPCMQVAAPWASGFVIYLMGITASMLSFQKFRRSLGSSKYLSAGMFLFIGMAIYILILPFQSEPVFSSPLNAVPLETANQPMGMAKGIFPGRVIWVFDKNATNANCTNAFNDGYFLDDNTNQTIVDQMLNNAILQITGETSLDDAWDAIFKFHNHERDKGAVGYVTGEKIFLKLNRTSSWSENINTSDMSRVNNHYYAISETSPQLVTSVLRQLVNIVGVPQEYIYVGDPMKHIYNDDYAKWHGEFPGVNYLDYKFISMGRQKVVASPTAVIHYSDKGTVLKTGTWASALTGDPVYKDYLYTIFEEMEYMLNLPTLKGHKFSGVTMFAKNHFGSHVRADAKHLHGGLVKPSPSDALRNSYGMYRVMVDIMGHNLLGRKNLLYIMDALYSSEMEVSHPVKFQKSPWHDHWSSSLFVSMDPVAIESVGFDVLYHEMDGSNGLDAFPHFGAVDDYLHQAADWNNWPDNIVYDPNGDGVLTASLGVHEHWNNPVERLYSRNLGIGDGIEMVFVDGVKDPGTGVNNSPSKSRDVKVLVYPNPATSFINIRYSSDFIGLVGVSVYDINGRVTKQLNRPKISGVFKEAIELTGFKEGVYFVQISENESVYTVKLIVE